MSNQTERTYVQRVQPRMIQQIWEQVRYGLQEAVPPPNAASEDAYTHILAALMAEQAQLWAVYSGTVDKPQVHAFVITVIRRDPITKEKYLHLYSIHAYRPLSDRDWDRMQIVVEKFAVGNECVELIAFTKNPMVKAQFERRGGLPDVQYWHKRLV